MTAPRSKSGFTILESLIVLVITGLTMSLLFSVGIRGAFTSFRLGNRALSTADVEIGKAAYRDVIADMVIPPVAVSSQAAELELADQTDDSFIGEPTQVAGYLIAGRETPCAKLGAEGRLTLSVEPTPLTTKISCQLDDNEPVLLTEVKWPGGTFSYSEDGAEWFDDWTVERGMPVETQALPNGEVRQVYVRLASADGLSQIIEIAAAGRPIAQTPPAQAAAGGGGGGGQQGGGGPGGGGRGGPDGAGRGGPGGPGGPGGFPGGRGGGGPGGVGRGGGGPVGGGPVGGGRGGR